MVDAVHAKGSVIFCQLWHVGRASHQGTRSILANDKHTRSSVMADSLASVSFRALEALSFPDFLHTGSRRKYKF